MKISSSWGSRKASRKRKRTVTKTRIRWELLGLKDPSVESSTQSMEEIRRQVSSMASRGFGSGARSRSSATDSTEEAGSDTDAPAPQRRRGATDSHND